MPKNADDTRSIQVLGCDGACGFEDGGIHSVDGIAPKTYTVDRQKLWVPLLIKGLLRSSAMRRIQERILGPRWMSAASSGSTIWLLGICYDVSPADDESVSRHNFATFLEDFSSRIWITYRQGFEPLGEGKFTTDLGWGCMIRSGQMLVAQAISCHHLGRNWRRQEMKQEYLRVLQYVWDSPAKESPLSLHNIVEIGQPFGVSAGAWLGPYGFCRAVEAIANSNRFKQSLPIQIYVVACDENGERGGAPVLCIDEVYSDPEELCPLLVLVPLVLGVDRINPRYLPSLRATFTFPQSVGIAGGKPGASIYLVGVQDDQTLYLDPHELQQAVNPCSDIDTSSYHTSVVRRMPLEAIDPSLALGFYCRNKGEFDDLCMRVSELAELSNGAPMFTVATTSAKKAADSRNMEANSCLESGICEDEWQIL